MKTSLMATLAVGMLAGCGYPMPGEPDVLQSSRSALEACEDYGEKRVCWIDGSTPGFQVCADYWGPCEIACGNGTCDGEVGETLQSCPNDCGGIACGSEICDPSWQI